MSRKIFIKELSRITTDGEIESLKFQKGVNLIIGESGTGKTVWLKMLDYLFGDRGTVEEALSSDLRLVEKYSAIQATINIGDDDFKIERNWHNPGAKGKIKIGEDQFVLSSDFSGWILEKLAVPQLKFPKGNPYVNNWVELSFRILYRHIYRQERFWNDIADKQPEHEQHAAIAQFLGIAEQIFSQSFDSSISASKELLKLESKKEQFEEILENLSRSMTSVEDENRIAFTTKDEIEQAIVSIEEEIETLISKRNDVLKENLANVNEQNKQRESLELEILSTRKGLLNDIEIVDTRIGELKARYSYFQELTQNVSNEITKLERSKVAGIISDLKVTHCPSCDQEVKASVVDQNHCFLCHQVIPSVDTQYGDRINFEVHQLTSERKELGEILTKYATDIQSLVQTRKDLSERVSIEDRKLVPLRQTLSGLTDERLSVIDSQRGRLEEKIENFKRLLGNFHYKEKLLAEIDRLNHEISVFDMDVEEKTSQINYETVCAAIEDGVNSYINQLKKSYPKIWPHGRVHFNIDERKFSFRVGDVNWTAISALNQEYFLLAYHYGLLSLSGSDKFNFPGLLVLDFPPQLGEDKKSQNALDYIVKPFISLCNKKGNDSLQVIFAGKTLSAIPNSSVNMLDKVWKSEDL
jgi:hypothetical protein